MIERGWDERPNEPDGEQTRLTRSVHAHFRTLGEEQYDDASEWAIVGSSLRFQTTADSGEEFVVNVRGQSSVTGHGKHGIDPGEIRELRELGVPVFLIFCDGPNGNVWSAWLHRVEDDVVPVDLATGHKRWGWTCRRLEQENGKLPAANFRLPHDIAGPISNEGKLFVT